MSEEVVPRTCQSCGQELQADARFCFACGAKVMRPDEKVTCPHCGASVANGAFCLNCGGRLTEAPARETALHAVDDTETPDGMLARAETFLSLEQYERASEMYARAVDRYPSDHRAWWGMLTAATHNWTVDFDAAEVDLAQILKTVKRLASAEEYAAYKAKLLAYFAEVDVLMDVELEDEELMQALLPLKRKRADRALAEHKYEEAFRIYKAYADACPTDHRGFWGILAASTKGFTEAEETYIKEPGCSSYAVWRKVKELASAEELAAYERQLVSWLRLMGKVEVECDAERIAEALTLLRRARVPFDDAQKVYETFEGVDREAFRNESTQRRRELADLQGKLDRALANETECARVIDKKESKRSFGTGCIVVGLLLALLGIIGSVATGETTVFFVAMIFVGIACALLLGGGFRAAGNTDEDAERSRGFQASITSLRSDISALTERISTEQQKYGAKAENTAKNLAVVKENLAVIVARIAALEAYLALPADKKFLLGWDYWCNEYGVKSDELPDDASRNVYNAMTDVFEHEIPVILRCEKCENQTIVYVDLLNGFDLNDAYACSFCEAEIRLGDFVCSDGTPNFKALRNGTNYRLYLQHAGLVGAAWNDEQEDDEEYEDEDYDDAEDAYDDDYGYDAEDEDAEEDDESFSVCLVSAGAYPAGVIKVLGDVLGCGTGEARELLEMLPYDVIYTSEKNALTIASRLRAAGATVEVDEA